MWYVLRNDLSELNDMLGIRHPVTTRHRPKSNGACKRHNSVISRIETSMWKEDMAFIFG